MLSTELSADTAASNLDEPVRKTTSSAARELLSAVDEREFWTPMSFVSYGINEASQVMCWSKFDAPSHAAAPMTQGASTCKRSTEGAGWYGTR